MDRQDTLRARPLCTAIGAMSAWYTGGAADNPLLARYLTGLVEAEGTDGMCDLTLGLMQLCGVLLRQRSAEMRVAELDTLRDTALRVHG